MNIIIKLLRGYGDILNSQMGGGGPTTVGGATPTPAAAPQQQSWISNVGQSVGGTALGSIVNEGLGLLFAGANRANADKQQQDFTNIQTNAEEQLGNFNYANQLKMWNATGPQAQVANLEKAGLNPALMYGAGAGGGGTTQGGTAGSVSGGTAQSAPSPAMGINSNINPMTSAQLQNVQANTHLQEAQAQKISGVDTTNVQANTDLAKMQTGNVQADTALKTIQTDIQSIDADFEKEKMTGTVIQIEATGSKITQETNQIKQQTDITHDMYGTIENAITQNYLNSVIQGKAMAIGINLTQAQTDQVTQGIKQRWAEIGPLDAQGQSAKVQELLSSAGLMDKEKSLLLTQTIIQGAGAIGTLLKNGTQAMQGAKQ